MNELLYLMQDVAEEFGKALAMAAYGNTIGMESEIA
jgi:hypothetical protein